MGTGGAEIIYGVKSGHIEFFSHGKWYDMASFKLSPYDNPAFLNRSEDDEIIGVGVICHHRYDGSAKLTDRQIATAKRKFNKLIKQGKIKVTSKPTLWMCDFWD